jgi:hypothetical protein
VEEALMPIKTVVCCECHREVPKASTAHVGDGKRACRTHPDTAAKAEAAQKALERPPASVQTRSPGRGLFGARPTSFEDLIGLEARMRHWADKECWLCGCTGIAIGPDYTMLLTALGRLGWTAQDFWAFSPKTVEEVRERTKVDIGVLLHQPKLPTDPSRRGPILDKLTAHPGSDMAVAELGWVQCCEKCADRCRLEVVPELRGPDVLTTLGLLLAIWSSRQKAKARDAEAPKEDAR